MEKPLVLIVEDDPLTNEMIAGILKSAGYRSVQAFTNAEGLQRVSENTFSLITTDRGHPGGESGIAFVTQARSMPNGRHVPILMISGSLTNENELAAWRAGVSGVMHKPFEQADLLAEIGKLSKTSEKDQMLLGVATEAHVKGSKDQQPSSGGTNDGKPSDLPEPEKDLGGSSNNLKSRDGCEEKAMSNGKGFFPSVLKVTLIILGVVVGLVGLGFAAYGVVTGVQSVQTAPLAVKKEWPPISYPFVKDVRSTVLETKWQDGRMYYRLSIRLKAPSDVHALSPNADASLTLEFSDSDDFELYTFSIKQNEMGRVLDEKGQTDDFEAKGDLALEAKLYRRFANWTFSWSGF